MTHLHFSILLSFEEMQASLFASSYCPHIDSKKSLVIPFHKSFESPFLARKFNKVEKSPLQLVWKGSVTLEKCHDGQNPLRINLRVLM